MDINEIRYNGCTRRPSIATRTIIRNCCGDLKLSANIDSVDGTSALPTVSGVGIYALVGGLSGGGSGDDGGRHDDVDGVRLSPGEVIRRVDSALHYCRRSITGVIHAASLLDASTQDAATETTHIGHTPKHARSHTLSLFFSVSISLYTDHTRAHKPIARSNLVIEWKPVVIVVRSSFVCRGCRTLKLLYVQKTLRGDCILRPGGWSVAHSSI